MIDVEDREILILFISCFGLIYLWRSRCAVAAIPGWRWLVAAFLCRLLGYICTVAEGVLSPTFAALANGCEHLAYVAHSAFLLLWVLRIWRERRVA